MISIWVRLKLLPPELVQGWSPIGWRGLWLIAQNSFNLLHDFRRQFRDNVESLEVVDDLLWLTGSEDDSARIRILGEPSKC